MNVASASSVPAADMSTSTATAPSSYSATRRLLASRQPVARWLQWLANGTSVVGLLFGIAVARSGEFADDYRVLAVIAVMLMAIVYHTLGVFTRDDVRRFRGVMRIAFAWSLTCILLIVLGFLTKSSDHFSRSVLLLWFASALVAQCLIQGVVSGTARLWTRHLDTATRSVVIGSGWLAASLALRINGNGTIGERVVGVVDDADAKAISHWPIRDVPVLASVDALESMIASGEVDRVYVALPAARSGEVVALQVRLLRHNIDVIWAPDIFAMNVVNPSVRELAGIPLISLSESPMASGARAYMKSLIDVCGALAALVALSPLFLVIAAAIRLTSEGPVFYRQQRTGWDGRRFEIWKFRSMYVHDEGPGCVTQARKGDARITPVGSFLRRTSIDELPQLINVLTGSMSLVGPRPHSVIHDEEFRALIDAYQARHRVKPGITGWAQVHGLRGEIRTIDDMSRRIEYDLQYINGWSLTRDLWILLRTPFALFHSNAY